MRLADCHPERKYHSKGLCKSCYDSHLKTINPGYKDRQISNTTKWSKENPDKIKIIQDRRKLKDSLDPLFKSRRRDAMLKRAYGINLDIYDEMLVNQGGGCKLCHRKPGKTPLHVDHDHVTKRVRGLLCHQCNWYMGTVDSDPSILTRIRDYRNEDDIK